MHVDDKLRLYLKPDGSAAYRPIKEQRFMKFAAETAQFSTCDRLSVGSVFVDKNYERILCSGYNGNYSGGPNGCDTNQPGMCGCIHAEQNSMTKSREDLRDSICFVTTAPCLMCSKLLINREISKIIYLQDYRNEEGLQILKSSGIEVIKYFNLPGLDRYILSVQLCLLIVK